MINVDRNSGCIIPNEEKWLGEHSIYPPEADLICYTDGSKRNGLTGAGYYCESPHLEASIFTGIYATVYQTEVFAISELSESEVLKNAAGKTIFICTDSQSAIETISSVSSVDSKIVRHCKTVLKEIGELNKVTILWVPSHVGIPGNEKADVLADAATGK